MGNNTPNAWRLHFLYACMLAMPVCLFVSRAALSISMMLFIAAATVHKDFLQQLKTFFKNPILVGMAVLFLIPFVSGLWSSDVQQWANLMRIKLPLLLLPIAFAGTWVFKKDAWQLLAIVFLLMVLAGTVWSFEKYWVDKQAMQEGYLKAKVFATPLQNDHVRFSWMVSVAVLLCLLLFEQYGHFKKFLVAGLVAWFVAYLHLLSARTGLLSLYLILGAYAFYILYKKRSIKTALALAGCCIALPLLAWLYVPTFQNRIKYFLYDLSFIKSNTYLPGANDGARVLSYKAGWYILKNNPLGVGAGDVYQHTNNWYSTHVNGMLPTDKLYPSSEWLLYGGTVGWAGVLLFTAVMVLPFFYPPKAHKFYWYLLCSTAAFSFVFDIGLEVQYGVFVYAFIVLWWWKWFSSPTENVIHA